MPRGETHHLSRPQLTSSHHSPLPQLWFDGSQNPNTQNKQYARAPVGAQLLIKAKHKASDHDAADEGMSRCSNDVCSNDNLPLCRAPRRLCS